MDFHTIVFALKSFGIRGIIRTILYANYRHRVDKKYSIKNPPVQAATPGNLVSTNRIQSGLLLEYEFARLEVVFLSANMVRVSWGPGRPSIPYSISNPNWEIQHPAISERPSDVELSNRGLQVIIDRSGSIYFKDVSGKFVKRDLPPTILGDHWKLTSPLFPEEHIYGLGDRASSLNLRPGKYTSWNTDVGGIYSHGQDPLYIGTPIYLSLSDAGSHLVYFENTFRSIFMIGDMLESSFTGGMLRYYVVFGPLESIFRQLADLTGYPYMPPLWSLGYHQSRWGYKNEDQVRSLIKGFEAHEMPLSAIHLDIDYMEGFRVFTVNRQRFANLSQLTKDLEMKGIKVVASINPAVKWDPKFSLYVDGLSKNVFCKLPDGQVMKGVSWPGWCVYPDFTDPTARVWWQNQYKVLLREGISGLWHDMNEPVSMAAWGDKTFPLSTQHSMEGQESDQREAHNIYGLLMDQAGFEAMRDFSPPKRPWILSRSGWAGMQRFAWNWTGDTESSWESLRQAIPTLLGLGLCGHGFSGVDIGGFSGSPSAELYLRWFQLATFLPLFRTHSSIGSHPREPWAFGEPTTSIIREFLKLRYKLLPYLYTLAWDATQTGMPLMRPLFWENLQDKTLWDIEDEFFLGDSILVAPVLYQNATHRAVILPPGIWYSYWDDQVYTGPDRIDQPVRPITIPMFIKGGTVLPMESEKQLTLHVYVDQSRASSSQVYFDEGEGYKQGRLVIYQQLPNQNQINIKQDSSGDYPFPYPSIKIQVHGAKVCKLAADGLDYPLLDNSATIPTFQELNLDLS